MGEEHGDAEEGDGEGGVVETQLRLGGEDGHRDDRGEGCENQTSVGRGGAVCTRDES